MPRFHLRFRDFREETLVATDALFAAKPWRLPTDDEKTVVAQQWLSALSAVYEVPEPRLVIGERIESDPNERRDSLERWDSTGDPSDPLAYSPEEDDEEEDAPEDMEQEIADVRAVIAIDHWSILLLFKRFREYALSNGVESGANRYEEDDIHGWACSLFYKVRPVMFRARVREGRIGRVSADDLLSTETLRAREESRRVTEEERVVAEMERESEAGFEDIDEAAIEAHATTVEHEFITAHEDGSYSSGPIRTTEEERVAINTQAELDMRIEIHTQAAGENVERMTTRPLRRYATSVGVGGVWEMNKDEILHELRYNQSHADVAQRVINASRSQTGAVR